MFEALWAPRFENDDDDPFGDDAAVNGEVADAAAAAPAAAEPAARRKRGRPAGWVHPAEVRLKMQRAASRRVAAAAETKARCLAEALNPSRQVQAAEQSFGLGERGRGAPGQVVATVGDGSGGFVRDYRRADTLHTRLWRRGVVSHVQAVRKALPDVVTSGSNMILSGVMDDANIWVKRPAGHGDTAVTKTKTGKQRCKRGRNVHVPALNVVQTLAVRKGDTVRAAKIHVPCQVLPKANWATIRSRWSQWFLYSSSGIGRKLVLADVALPFGLGLAPAVLRSSVKECSWKAILLTMDNLQANLCIVAEEQMGLQADRRTLLLDLACQHHSAALCSKPLITKLGDGALASAYVRIGHILESSRAFKSYVEALDAEVDKSFEFRLVPELPQDVVEARAKARQWLVSTQVARDLSDEDIDNIIAIDNSPWESDDLVHYCVRGGCTCAGDRADAKRRMKEVIRLSLGGGIVVPLLYRFKHMEEASAKILRGRLQHDLMRRALRRMYPEQARRKARADAAAAAGEELPFAVKQAVRGDQVLAFFDEKDADAKYAKQAHIIPAPLQRFMNVCFKAEGAVTKAMLALTTDPSTETTKQLCAESFKLNSEILSGRRGCDVLVGYTEALEDFRSDPWKGLPLNDDEQFECACHMLCALGSAWKRLCDVTDQPRYRIFAACHIRGVKVFDPNHIKQVVDPLVASRAICSDCVDREFTGKLLAVLASGQLPFMREATELLADILTCLRTSSVSVERAHLPAEEAKPLRARGRAMEVSTLSAHTYRRLVRDEHRLVHERVLDKVLGDAGLSHVQFSACLRGGRYGHVGSDGKARLGHKRPRSLAGIDVFRTENWNRELKAVIGSPEHAAEMRRIVQAWSAVSAEVRADFERRAEGENSARADAREVGNIHVVDELGLRSHARQELVRQVAQQAMKRIVEHPVWKAGLGIWSHSSAVDSTLVSQDRQELIQVLR